jgi:hypothetical protein
MSKIILTYDDYAALPDDGLRYELHEGELSVTPAPGARHQLVIGNLRRKLARTIEAYHLDGGAYRLVATLDGNEPHALPPFVDLPLDPAAVWR